MATDYTKSMMQLRLEARERGDRFFNTATPCSHGHMSKRYASNGCCVECLRPGASQRSLDKYQAAVVKRFAFWCLVPTTTPEETLHELKRYLATCMMNWEAQRSISPGMNNWGPKINNQTPF